MAMTHDALLNELWTTTLTRLGGGDNVAALARETRAFLRPRGIKSAVDLLRFILAYCLGGMGLRSTATWAASVGLANVSDVALLGRLRNSTAWMERLVAVLLADQVRAAALGRPVRIVDSTTVSKAGCEARASGKLWRVHTCFDLPSERFTYFELTDEKGAEKLDMVPVVAGEIRIADRGYMKAHRIAAVLAAGGDVIVRAGWKHARWLNQDGTPLDMIATLDAALATGAIDRPIWIARKDGAPLRLRLVALRKPPHAIPQARLKARREATKEGRPVNGDTLKASEWTILVTSLDATAFPAAAIGELYRSRWRIELAFKRLKSILGLAGPPGADPSIAKTWILAHLLMILLLEPHLGAPEVSPRSGT